MRSPVSPSTVLHLHLDAVGGIAGDMFIAAMLDAFPELLESVVDAIRTALPPGQLDCRASPHHDHTLSGKRFSVERAASQPRIHVRYSQVRNDLEASHLAAEVKVRALGLFALLADAEAAIHGESTETVTFHELGDWDSVADIVGVAALLSALPQATWSVSTLPIGRGFVRCAHGQMPVPSPVTARLLEGYAVVDDGIEGERITPTGAAILTYVRATQTIDRAPRTLSTCGYGFGTKTFTQLSNVLRVTAFERAGAALLSDQVTVLQFDVDDQSPEDLGIALEHLRQVPAVLDVLQIPAFGKKGRMTAHIQVVARPDGTDEVVRSCFAQTSTLGIRTQLVERQVLPRREDIAQVEGRAVRIKIAERADVQTEKVESDDLRDVPGGLAGRDHVRQQATLRRRRNDND